VLKALMAAHHEALDVLRRCAFGRRHVVELEVSGQDLFDRHRQLAAQVYGGLPVLVPSDSAAQDLQLATSPLNGG
jgi:hypothetical protein